MRTIYMAVVVLGLIGMMMTGSAIAAEVIIAAPTDDVYIWSAFPDTNYNYYPESTKLIAGHSYIGPHDQHSLLRFDLSALPDDAVVTSAGLYVYCLPTCDEVVYAHRMGHDDWDEDLTTWNTYEPYLGDALLLDWHRVRVVAYETPNYWECWDLMAMDWQTDLADNVLTLLLRASPESMNYFSPANMASKEFQDVEGNYYRPYLLIDYVPEPATMGLLGVGLLALLRRRAA
ncbi:MAG: DNRLRE domain-containing protein [Planctomycetes bacterium]|nr:DNRLRE domain-containing protein [Planctomycetota bacterium]